MLLTSFYIEGEFKRDENQIIRYAKFEGQLFVQK